MSKKFEHPKGRKRITDLDENLVIEILSHLPCQHVIVCKSVCKFWNSLISAPYFVCRFLSHRLRITNKSEMEKEQPWTFIYASSHPDSISIPPFRSTNEDVPKLTCRDSIFRSPGFSLSFVPCFHPHLKAIRVLRTFNDLILCCELKYSGSNTYYICNPITIQYVALPPAPPVSSSSRELRVDFLCEPYYQKHHQNEDVHVVLNTQYRFWVIRSHKFINSVNKDDLELQIFSSETGKWDQCQVSIPEDFADFGVWLHHVESLALHRNNILITTTVLNGTGVQPQPGLIKVSYPNNNPNIKDQSGPLLKFAKLEFNDWQEPNKPDISIWQLNENDFEWRLADLVFLNEFTSDDIDVTENFRQYLAEGFASTCRDFLGQDSQNQNVVYLNINTDDIGMIKFDTQSRTMVSLRKHRIEKSFHDILKIFQIVVPFWPTLMPHVSSC